MAKDLGAVIRMSREMQAEMNGKAQQRRLLAAANAVAKVANEAVPKDIGDQSFSHWKQKGGAGLDMTAGVRDNTAENVTVGPKPLNRRGPWRVLESGRQEALRRSNGSLYRVAGRRFSKKLGVMVDKNRRVKRFTGSTRGWHTWTRAQPDMAKEATKAFTVDVIQTTRKVWG